MKALCLKQKKKWKAIGCVLLCSLFLLSGCRTEKSEETNKAETEQRQEEREEALIREKREQEEKKQAAKEAEEKERAEAIKMCIRDRLVNRIGLVDGIKEPKKVEMELWKIIPPEEGSDFCHRLVYHGREVCTARTRPHCDKCCLADICKKQGI